MTAGSSQTNIASMTRGDSPRAKRGASSSRIPLLAGGTLAAASLAFLASIVTIFFVLVQLEQKMAEVSRENSLWDCYQLDREAVRTLSAVEAAQNRIGLVTRDDLDRITSRYDILYSRVRTIDANHRLHTMNYDTSIIDKVEAVNAAILGMAPAFDGLEASRDVLAQLSSLRTTLSNIITVTGGLLGSVHQHGTERTYRLRDETISLHRFLAFAVAGLALTMLAVSYGIWRQMRASSEARAKMERVERENLEKSLALAQRDEQAALMSREAALAEQIAAFTNRMNASVTSLASMIEGITGQCMTMAKAAERARLGSREAADSSARVAEHVSRVARSADSMSDAVRDIFRKTVETGRTAHGVHDDADRTGETIRDLVAAAAQIDSVAQLIAEVAGRTNLLALNATIEAARAGESGRGFAVVAGEVKSLANQTASATSEIARQIEAIQTATSSCVAAMDNIRRRIVSLGTIGEQISLITKDQSQMAEGVATMINDAAAETTRASSTVGSVMEATERANAAAEAVLGLMVSVNEEGRRIRREIETFRASVGEPFGSSTAA
ncbi:methyl-accepting chemotaxis protein [uncultured Alsobacter sp.]|uniref:methyl-accepting chemotaxis protein n=1 Tax=uncultured Alsobacter sp. TaxID=1748258 RepID=UPI0025FB1D5C|nr:methyl-accepting chemotaxis protein [uncultured Alsobacter sp.]